MAWFTILIAVTLVIFAYWENWRSRNKRLLDLAALVPGPPAYPLIGNALLFMFMSGEQLLDKIAGLLIEYGEYCKFWLGPDLNIVVKNPADIKLLLSSNKVNQKGPSYEMMETYIGPGILTGGPTWRNHRKIATPSYSKKSVHHYEAIFNQEAKQLVQVFCNKDQNVVFDAYLDVVYSTTQCVCQTLMGFSKEESQNLKRLQEVVLATPRIYDLIFTKMTKPWLHIPFIYWLTGGKRTEDHYLRLLDDFVSDVVEKRRRELEKSGAADEDTLGIVDRFILSKELSEREIKWETFSLFTTSQEASAKITSGVLLFLAHLPDWQEKVYNEIMEVVGPDGDVTSEDLKKLPYLDMIYKEALRFLSIAALIQRTVEEEISINDGKIILPVGTTLAIPIHEVHRDPRYWEDPLKIKPERFLPENIKARDPNAFIPFSLGPMDCLGRVYATALIKILVIWVLRHVRLEGSGSLDGLQLHVAISVKYANGYNIKVIPRKHCNGKIIG